MRAVLFFLVSTIAHSQIRILEVEPGTLKVNKTTLVRIEATNTSQHPLKNVIPILTVSDQSLAVTTAAFEHPISEWGGNSRQIIEFYIHLLPPRGKLAYPNEVPTEFSATSDAGTQNICRICFRVKDERAAMFTDLISETRGFSSTLHSKELLFSRMAVVESIPTEFRFGYSDRLFLVMEWASDTTGPLNIPRLRYDLREHHQCYLDTINLSGAEPIKEVLDATLQHGLRNRRLVFDVTDHLSSCNIPMPYSVSVQGGGRYAICSGSQTPIQRASLYIGHFQTQESLLTPSDVDVLKFHSLKFMPHNITEGKLCIPESLKNAVIQWFVRGSGRLERLNDLDRQLDTVTFAEPYNPRIDQVEARIFLRGSSCVISLVSPRGPFRAMATDGPETSKSDQERSSWIYDGSSWHGTINAVGDRLELYSPENAIVGTDTRFNLTHIPRFVAFASGGVLEYSVFDGSWGPWLDLILELETAQNTQLYYSIPFPESPGAYLSNRRAFMRTSLPSDPIGFDDFVVPETFGAHEGMPIRFRFVCEAVNASLGEHPNWRLLDFRMTTTLPVVDNVFGVENLSFFHCQQIVAELAEPSDYEVWWYLSRDDLVADRFLHYDSVSNSNVISLPDGLIDPTQGVDGYVAILQNNTGTKRILPFNVTPSGGGIHYMEICPNWRQTSAPSEVDLNHDGHIDVRDLVISVSESPCD